MFAATAFLAVIGLAAFLRWRADRPSMPESLFRVDFDEVKITVTHPRGEPQVVSWVKLAKIGIRTTDDGPWDMDLFWGLHEAEPHTGVAVFPGGATGEQALISALHRRFPGFNSENLVRAMASTSNAYFVLWESEKPIAKSS
jgi:hypothetical protein